MRLNLKKIQKQGNYWPNECKQSTPSMQAVSSLTLRQWRHNYFVPIMNAWLFIDMVTNSDLASDAQFAAAARL